MLGVTEDARGYRGCLGLQGMLGVTGDAQGYRGCSGLQGMLGVTGDARGYRGCGSSGCSQSLLPLTGLLEPSAGHIAPASLGFHI